MLGHITVLAGGSKNRKANGDPTANGFAPVQNGVATHKQHFAVLFFFGRRMKANHRSADIMDLDQTATFGMAKSANSMVF